MRTFVVSDIHGHYDTFMKMLKKIEFQPEDFLYIVGDVIDRGRDGIQLIQYIREQDNMEMFLGNHELMMLNVIEYQRAKAEGRIKEDPMDEHLTPYELWTHPANGGEDTFLDFYNLKKKEQDEIEAFLKGLRLIKRVKIGSRTFHISHSYSLNRRFGKELFYKDAAPQEAERIVWDSLFDRMGNPYDDPSDMPFYYKSDHYIVGHIFTQRLNHLDEKGRGKIFRSAKYRGYNVTDMDCGMAINSKSSRLGCMQLENGKEYYVALVGDD
ncbi:MAG: metallophosphoesterase [Lachnospiraceae bacterium]|nr:metallophosphoesterase [Lachnospiraceae bacterium]